MRSELQLDIQGTERQGNYLKELAEISALRQNDLVQTELTFRRIM